MLQGIWYSFMFFLHCVLFYKDKSWRKKATEVRGLGSLNMVCCIPLYLMIWRDIFSVIHILYLEVNQVQNIHANHRQFSEASFSVKKKSLTVRFFPKNLNE